MPSLTDCRAAVGSNDAINFNEGLSTEISSGTKKNDASVVFPDIVIHGTFLSSSLGQPEAVVVQTRLHEEQMPKPILMEAANGEISNKVRVGVT